jgi:hypothetical protein
LWFFHFVNQLIEDHIMEFIKNFRTAIQVALGADPLELKVKEAQAQKAQLQKEAAAKTAAAVKKTKVTEKAKSALVGLSKAKVALEKAEVRELEAQSSYDEIAENFDDLVSSILYGDPVEIEEEEKAPQRAQRAQRATKPTKPTTKTPSIPKRAKPQGDDEAVTPAAGIPSKGVPNVPTRKKGDLEPLPPSWGPTVEEDKLERAQKAPSPKQFFDQWDDPTPEEPEVPVAKGFREDDPDEEEE